MNRYKVRGEQVVYFEFEVFANSEEEAISDAPNWHMPSLHITDAEEIDIHDIQLIEEDINEE